MQDGELPAGITSKPDSEGYFTYTRPEGKQGGHGVGWSELPRYSFKVPPGWKETPVSIADLGGTEVGRQAAKLVGQQWAQQCCTRQAGCTVHRHGRSPQGPVCRHGSLCSCSCRPETCWSWLQLAIWAGSNLM